ncbi:precorrin-2 C(20)-methyltransferase [Garciella nitratireducens]|uniref:Precorrin-2/cobalt-factor-2 C20-methyltransferase n=1 Tax=Garciella nitratireducens DSM 15102 TaxID=1121911 RepID=A0A1T4KIL8_9FIRM|nr:precorrin-2 C(20)-methyltransferase [Garciella nitratireducens]RBP41560.1 precorrin-2/cobalt-factor-2 C20-methyltransferase [Garciella nitratireducens]SJZ42226.1 precorrin-2/cobalt-factor-2 C20-methyltransferase [Garciella nitratireducens DSM 15102]
MAGVFYGVGVGPGDPKLLTLKAVEIIQSVDVLICPEGKKDKGSVALEIIKDYMKSDTELLKLTFPMVYKEGKLKEEWQRNIEIIYEKLQEKKKVAFITLGDPMLYSTYLYIFPEIQKRGVKVETIPGIPSFCAVASKSNIPLAKGEENLMVYPLRKNGDGVDKLMDQFDNLVIMKPSNQVQQLAKILKKRNLENHFVLVTKCGTDEEELIQEIYKLEQGVPYLSTMLIKRRKIYE